MPKITNTKKARATPYGVTHVYDENGNLYELTFEDEVPAPRASKKAAATPAKTAKAAATPAKGSKTPAKASKRPAVTPVAEEEEYDMNPEKAFFEKRTGKTLRPKKVPSPEELIDDDEAEERVAKEKERRYREAKKLIRAYEKEKSAGKWESLPEWKKADKLLTNAASIRVRYQGLLNADLNNQKHLPKAVQPLRIRGEKQFAEAMAIIEQLSPEEVELLWSAQERNRGVTSFEDLVTKKEFDEAQRLVSTSIGQGFSMEEEEPEDELAADTVADDQVADAPVEQSEQVADAAVEQQQEQEQEQVQAAEETSTPMEEVPLAN